jgi:hypothetical protein
VDLGFVAMCVDLRPKVQAGLIVDLCLFHIIVVVRFLINYLDFMYQ